MDIYSLEESLLSFFFLLFIFFLFIYLINGNLVVVDYSTSY